MVAFNIYTIGCGSAKPSLRHDTSCTLVEYDNRLMMIDCGEGTQKQLLKYGIKQSHITDIFITHLHADHVLGLPGFVATTGLSDRTEPLTIHTFEEGKKILTEIFDFFSPYLPFRINFNVIENKEAIIYEDSKITVETIPLDHSVPAVGYIFREKEGERHIIPEMVTLHGVPFSEMKGIKQGADFIKENGEIVPNELLTTPPDKPRSYAHISDTRYMPELAKKIGPVNLIYHETTYLDKDCEKALNHSHSTALQAATVARDAGAYTFLTGHYSSRYKDDTPIKEEAEKIFPNVILNNEGLITPVV